MSWQQLLDIHRENAARYQDEQSRPPEACPNDGTPLVEHNGVWHCDFDGYRWPA